MLLTNNIIRRIICIVIEYKTEKNITAIKILQDKRKQTTDKKRKITEQKKDNKQNILKGAGRMSFPISAGLLDSMVLSIVSREDTYGYEITQTMRKAVDVSESTLYPVLKRLQKSQMLETYDKEFMGRNRRYYHVTSKGAAQLNDYRNEWVEHKNKVDSILLNEQKTEDKTENDNKILKEEELLPQEA